MPIAPTKGGRTMGTSTTAARSFFPGKSKRAAMIASGKLSKLQRIVTVQASARLVRSCERNVLSCRTLASQKKERWPLSVNAAEVPLMTG